MKYIIKRRKANRVTRSQWVWLLNTEAWTRSNTEKRLEVESEQEAERILKKVANDQGMEYKIQTV